MTKVADIIAYSLVIGVAIFFVYYWAYLVPSSEIVIAESTCETLLESIKTSTPNYQYDLREWVSKECWK